MKNILILGSGLVARPIIRYLLSKNYQVTVASNTPDRSDAMIAGNIYGTSVFWEAGDEDSLDRMIASHDIAVSLLPYVFHVMVAKHCVTHQKNMVTTSYVKPEMHALDVAAKEAGIILLNEMGLDPGIDHMSAMRIIDKVHQREGAILEFYSICGALPAPEAANNPFRYKFSWSPKGVVLAGNNDAVFLQNGKIVDIPTRNLFKNPFRVSFPEVGELEVYPNRDSMAYKEIYGIPEARTMFRGTFRYNGWCETLDAMKQLNLISAENTNMAGMWLNNTNLTSSNLSGANLTGASLYSADLSGANLQNATLNGANLVGADISGADLRGANLDGVIFNVVDFTNRSVIDEDIVISILNQAARNALLIDANLCGARYDSKTRWSKGYSIPSCAVLIED